MEWNGGCLERPSTWYPATFLSPKSINNPPDRTPAVMNQPARVAPIRLSGMRFARGARGMRDAERTESASDCLRDGPAPAGAKGPSRNAA